MLLSLRHYIGVFHIEVGRCKLDPSLKATPGFIGSTKMKSVNFAFNLNLVFCLSLSPYIEAGKPGLRRHADLAKLVGEVEKFSPTSARGGGAG